MVTLVLRVRGPTAWWLKAASAGRAALLLACRAEDGRPEGAMEEQRNGGGEGLALNAVRTHGYHLVSASHAI